jgi:hypothetical protein
LSRVAWESLGGVALLVTALFFYVLSPLGGVALFCVGLTLLLVAATEAAWRFGKGRMGAAVGFLLAFVPGALAVLFALTSVVGAGQAVGVLPQPSSGRTASEPAASPTPNLVIVSPSQAVPASPLTSPSPTAAPSLTETPSLTATQSQLAPSPSASPLPSAAGPSPRTLSKAQVAEVRSVLETSVHHYESMLAEGKEALGTTQYDDAYAGLAALNQPGSAAHRFSEWQQRSNYLIDISYTDAFGTAADRYYAVTGDDPEILYTWEEHMGDAQTHIQDWVSTAIDWQIRVRTDAELASAEQAVRDALAVARQDIETLVAGSSQG